MLRRCVGGGGDVAVASFALYTLPMKRTETERVERGERTKARAGCTFARAFRARLESRSDVGPVAAWLPETRLKARQRRRRRHLRRKALKEVTQLGSAIEWLVERPRLVWQTSEPPPGWWCRVEWLFGEASLLASLLVPLQRRRRFTFGLPGGNRSKGPRFFGFFTSSL